MTSEILILTPSAVALAADSAVTIDGRKTYNGVNKLFMLSNKPPMGIMTYNLSNFSSIPLETLIKEFRNEINGELKTVLHFKNCFEEFLNKLLENSNHISSFQEILSKFINNITNDIEHVNNSMFEDIVNNIASKVNYDDLKDYYEDIIEKINQSESEINNLIPENMGESKKAKFLENLKKFIIFKLFIEPYIGIVIAGFDDDKLFPSYIEFKITYLYENKFILKVNKKHDDNGNPVDIYDNKGNQVHVRPLAQGDVINTFLGSIDEYTEYQIINYFDKIHIDYIDKLEKAMKNNPKLKDKQDEVLDEINKVYKGNQLLTKDFESFLNELKKQHSKPILESIGALPKEELSNLAESLIKITSIKRKVQDDLETVGGPIDVAIITKGDGFIWTKRKHYFDGEMNPQFFERNKNI